MPFTVEDGTGVADANALIDVAFADTYFADRNNTVWAAALTTNKEFAIVAATDYMELIYYDRWKGTLSPDATTLSFPRQYFYDRKGELVDFTADGIPDGIKKAVAEYALRALTAALLPDPTVDDPSGKVLTFTKRKVGPIETENEFLPGLQKIIRKYPVPDKLLRFWLMGTGAVYR